MAKKIVITGAGEGLGKALGRRFAKDGDTVILLGRTLSKVEAAAEEFGNGAMAVHCDVSDPDSVRSAFAEIAKVHDKVDVLINNAAIYEPFWVRKARDEQITSALMTNIAGPMFCSREAIPMLNRGGLVINVSSESVDTRFPMFALYQSSKAALERFSEALRQELEEFGVRVTVVRAGQMMGENKGIPFPEEVRKEFGMACMKAGLDMRTRPISQFANVTDIFRALVDMPDDLQAHAILLEAFKA